MTENMKKLMKRLTADKAAANAVFECETYESAFTAATAIAGGYTFEEFKTEMETLKNAAQKQVDEDLPDQELGSVVGGGAYNDINERLLAERYRRGQLRGERII